MGARVPQAHRIQQKHTGCLVTLLTESRAETGINNFLVQTGRWVCMYRSLNMGTKHFHCQNMCRCSRHGERLDHMGDIQCSLIWGNTMQLSG